MPTTRRLNNFLLTLFGFEKAKGAGHIALVVAVHIACWCVFFFLPVLLYPARINENVFRVREWIDKVMLVAVFYLNYYLLIPRLFEKRKYALYAGCIVSLFLLCYAQRMVFRVNNWNRNGGVGFVRMTDAPAGPRRFVFNVTSGPGVEAVYFGNDSLGARPNPDSLRRLMPPFPLPEPVYWGIPQGVWIFTLGNCISSFLLLLLMAGFIRLAYSFLRNQDEKKALENAKLNAEVNFLKAQINPHFLFNTLNSIYAQAHQRSENTEFSVLKLSELLRYSLYDSAEAMVDLARDIQYINNYIDFQRMRLSSRVSLDYEVKGSLAGHRIAPMLLITFIENAFKHGISYTQASSIHIAIEVFEETLTLLIRNPVVERNSFVHGGLGLKNVTRRLDLLYPGKYLLDVHHDDYLYIVNLKLSLK